MSEEDDEQEFLFGLIPLMNLFSSKKQDVASWDYCQLVLRTLVNKFIKYRWPRQALVASLSTPELTERFIVYAHAFKKGNKLLLDIFDDVNKKRIKLIDFQQRYFRLNK